MNFKVGKWLSDIDTYRHLVSKGFKVMEHVSGVEINNIMTFALQTLNLELIEAMIDNGLDLRSYQRCVVMPAPTFRARRRRTLYDPEEPRRLKARILFGPVRRPQDPVALGILCVGEAAM